MVNFPIHIYLVSMFLWFSIWYWKKDWKIGFLVGYLFLVFADTVLLRSTGEFRYELTPFWSWGEVLSKWPLTPRGIMFLHQILLNILMFVPVGITLSQKIEWKSIPLAFCISLIIELTQLLSRRGIFEFDDIIHNTTGAILGYGLLKLRKHYKQSMKKLGNKLPDS